MNLYNKEKQDIIMAVNRSALEDTPMQIRISIENALKKLNSISVIGCEGYTKMKKIAGRKINLYIAYLLPAIICIGVCRFCMK